MRPIDVPDDILLWPDDRKVEWLARELWIAATGDEDALAPAEFVAAFVKAAALLIPSGDAT